MKEAQARIKINKLLEEAGWRFFDNEQGKANIVLENNIKITKHHIDQLGEDFETTHNGFVDFLLLDKQGFPFIVLADCRREQHFNNTDRGLRPQWPLVTAKTA